MNEKTTIATLALVLAFAVHAPAEGQSADLVGDWRAVLPPAPGESPTVFDELLRSLPGAIYTLTPATTSPPAMSHKNLGYRYAPSLPAITISLKTANPPSALGFLQSQPSRKFEGELMTPTGCWMHLSLEKSADGLTLSGVARINKKLSTDQCRTSLTKEAKRGEPFRYALIRLK